MTMTSFFLEALRFLRPPAAASPAPAAPGEAAAASSSFTILAGCKRGGARALPVLTWRARDAASARRESGYSSCFARGG